MVDGFVNRIIKNLSLQIVWLKDQRPANIFPQLNRPFDAREKLCKVVI